MIEIRVISYNLRHPQQAPCNLMKLLYTLITLALGGGAFFYWSDQHPQFKEKVDEFILFRTTRSMEIRYGAEQIMEKEQKTLLKEKGSRFLEPELTFAPYLLLQVKYHDGKKPKEGTILWDLSDGEMVLNTKSWEKTHGFADCIVSGARKSEIEVVALLAKKGGSLDAQTIASHLHLEPAMSEFLLAACQKKNLIFPVSATRYRLHLEHPKLTTTPETHFDIPLSMKEYKKAERLSGQYSSYQVKKIAQMTFGAHFSIRSSKEIYLPVYRICIQQGNGVLETVLYNALTGKRLPRLL